jgi:UDP-N-acetylmuramyl pentapeptide synthase
VTRSVRDVPGLLRNPVGRQVVYDAVGYQLWPLLRPLAGAYRRSITRRTRFVAVVGSAGKTTTARALAAALDARPPRTWNGFSRLAAALLRIRPSERRAVIEVGINGPGQMAGYAALVRPCVTVVTSIGSDHHQALGSLEATRGEKAGMVRALPPDGVAILNGDDPNVAWMATQTRARIVRFGFGPDNDVHATDLELDWPRGTRFRLHANGGVRQVEVRLMGKHQVYAALAAIAVALVEEVPLDAALGRLADLPPSRGRLEPVALANGAILLCDDFKASLETIDAALDLLATIPADRRTVVLGDISDPPGPEGPIYERLGARLAEVADRAIIVGQGYEAYASGARTAGAPSSHLTTAGDDPLGAARALSGQLVPGEVVLVKGQEFQRLERVALALRGQQVRCDIPTCAAFMVESCQSCPMLRRGWEGLPVVT